jgi:hypothetical protein
MSTFFQIRHKSCRLDSSRNFCDCEPSSPAFLAEKGFVPDTFRTSDTRYCSIVNCLQTVLVLVYFLKRAVFLDKFYLLVCHARKKLDNFSLPRSLVPKLIMSAFGQGRLNVFV